MAIAIEAIEQNIDQEVVLFRDSLPGYSSDPREVIANIGLEKSNKLRRIVPAIETLNLSFEDAAALLTREIFILDLTNDPKLLLEELLGHRLLLVEYRHMRDQALLELEVLSERLDQLLQKPTRQNLS